MITFISTFPPIICGIGDYLWSVVCHRPFDQWKVISPRIEYFSSSGDELPEPIRKQVDYCLSLNQPSLPDIDDNVIWFQHSFGMWGTAPDTFVTLLKEAREKGKKVVATIQGLHFQSEETPYGLMKKEYNLLKASLPYLDVLTVFTRGVYDVVTQAFPEAKERTVVLMHGFHIYPSISKYEARKGLFNYLLQSSSLSSSKRSELKQLMDILFSEKTLLLGNFGFITYDRAPLSVYELRAYLQKKLRNYRVIALYIGQIQKRADRDTTEFLPLLRQLEATHDGQYNLFYDLYLPSTIFPLAFRALDFVIIWYKRATISGRMAHALGSGACVVGRNIEGVGETLRLVGLPSASSAEQLAEQIETLVHNPHEREQLEKKAFSFANRFSFAVQAQKHIQLAESLCQGNSLPELDLNILPGAQNKVHLV